MTTMGRQSVLLLWVVIGLFATVHSQGLTPFSDSFETTTGVVIPCGSRCVVQSYREVLDTANKCVMSNTGIMMEIEKYLSDNNLNGSPTYQQIYNAFFSEGKSPLCGWYTTYGGCFETELGRICGTGIKTALTKLMTDFNKLFCSTDPNYLACVTHPSLLGIDSSQSSSSPYVVCTLDLIKVFQTITTANYYTELILKNNGDTLFTALRTFGNCIGDVIKTVTVSPPTGCAVVGDDVKKYIVDAINYFDFGKIDGKDYLKCFSNGDLHTKLTPCGMAFVNDLDAVLPGGSSDVLTELNATLYKGQPSVIAGSYNTLSSCLKQATKQACSADTDSVAIVDQVLLPLDRFFDGNTGNDDIEVCGTTPAPSLGNRTKASAASLELLVSGILMLLFVIQKLH